MEQFDVVVVGAGLSGVCAGARLQARRPGKSYVVLEGREAIGGTWDLFRYPGIRSDSDMYTLGYSFRPWRNPKAIADGGAILDYVRDTARELGVDRHIRFRHRVVRADWSSAAARWTVEADCDGETRLFSCRFLFMCSGYYRYDAGYAPEFAGAADFRGRIVHPQFWTDDVDYAGKRVVVIGSGATAVTLAPELAKGAAHVTMLQRSPTYVVSRPSQDRVANALRRRLPGRVAHGLVRWKNVLLGMYFYQLARRRPQRVKALIVGGVRQALGRDYDVATHFTPRYNPWDQRMCLIPDGDLFDAVREGRVSVVTDAVDRFTPGGVRLASGGEIPADLIVTATGLEMQPMGGATIAVDGVVVDFGRTVSYKGMMYGGVPNLASAYTYTNASWTLKCELTCDYVCRLLNYMDTKGFSRCTPVADGVVAQEPSLSLTSGYVLRAAHLFPKQGAAAPWRLHQNYALDLMALRFGRVTDAAMRFA